jgi:hypothetical protein
MSAKAMLPATDTRGNALRRRGRRWRALLAVAGSILMGAAPAAAAAGRWAPLGPFGAPVVALAVTARRAPRGRVGGDDHDGSGEAVQGQGLEA